MEGPAKMQVLGDSTVRALLNGKATLVQIKVMIGHKLSLSLETSEPWAFLKYHFVQTFSAIPIPKIRSKEN